MPAGLGGSFLKQRTGRKVIANDSWGIISKQSGEYPKFEPDLPDLWADEPPAKLLAQNCRQMAVSPRGSSSEEEFGGLFSAL